MGRCYHQQEIWHWISSLCWCSKSFSSKGSLEAVKMQLSGKKIIGKTLAYKLKLELNKMNVNSWMIIPTSRKWIDFFLNGREQLESSHQIAPGTICLLFEVSSNHMTQSPCRKNIFSEMNSLFIACLYELITSQLDDCCNYILMIWDIIIPNFNIYSI